MSKKQKDTVWFLLCLIWAFITGWLVCKNYGDVSWVELR